MRSVGSDLFVVVNCDRMAPGHTLGVAHFAFRLLESIRSADAGVRVLSKVTPDLVGAYQGLIGRVCDGVVGSEYEAALDLGDAPITPRAGERVIEYSPHHFQARITSEPAIVTCHDLHVFDIPWKYPNQREVADRFIENMRTASAVLTHFPRTARDVSARAPGIEDRVFLTESPAMLDATRPEDDIVLATARKFGLDGDRGGGSLLYPAQLQQHKNHRNLLEGLALARARGVDARLICPGSDFRPSFTASIKEHAASLGLGDAVTFPGFVEDDELRALYALCDAVIAPSLAEGGAYIALEGVLFRRAVAVGGIDSARLHLEMMGADGVLTFDPYSPTAIADTIKTLLGDGARLAGLNEAARRRVASWSFDAVARRYLACARWALGEGEKPGAIEVGSGPGLGVDDALVEGGEDAERLGVAREDVVG